MLPLLFSSPSRPSWLHWAVKINLHNFCNNLQNIQWRPAEQPLLLLVRSRAQKGHPFNSESSLEIFCQMPMTVVQVCVQNNSRSVEGRTFKNSAGRCPSFYFLSESYLPKRYSHQLAAALDGSKANQSGFGSFSDVPVHHLVQLSSLQTCVNGATLMYSNRSKACALEGERRGKWSL